jgi:oligoendopeptidase F
MKRNLLRIAALCLCVAMLFAGCRLEGLLKDLGNIFGEYELVKFGDMEYTRPDMEDFRAKYKAVNDALAEGKGKDDLMDVIYTFYESYYEFYTAYFLADIHYCMDLTDEYWGQEYAWCMEYTSEVSANVDQLLHDLADCPLKEELEKEEFFGEDFFDDYMGESLWSEEFQALMEQESALQTRYYELNDLSADMDLYSEQFFKTYGYQMAELFVELVKVRQQIAAEAGYDDYLSFAYAFYHDRDYTPEQAMDYMEQVRRELVPMYRDLDLDTYWSIGRKNSTESQTFDYVRDTAISMGGKVKEAFELLRDGELYNISYGKNKYNASFEIFLPKYMEPFIFVNPTGRISDQLTFVHEFGHFCNDYASYGTSVGVDVAEIFSQGMEYLSLCYGEGRDDHTYLKMVGSLSTFVEQSAYASFEHQVYSLKGDDLTVENVYALYDTVGRQYGFDTWGFDRRDFVLVTHFFTSPMYVISYVVSNDAALQLYQLEKEKAGAGLMKYQQNLDSQEEQFLAFLESAGLENPFTSGRVARIRQTLKDVLK